MESKEIENRLGEEILSCQNIMQYIDAIYSPENFHMLEIAEGAKQYFNDLYVIKIDYLTQRTLAATMAG